LIGGTHLIEDPKKFSADSRGPIDSKNRHDSKQKKTNTTTYYSTSADNPNWRLSKGIMAWI